ncbi:3-deoxy-7-phosphoheptulonate synthase [Litorilituus lipolyticus]|uniref:3-deoxy-7-phosphoheptulonate synthase n=1 Tax=Litorilituus lipolyticus TaxID=2491017 RepID=A0A502LA71_9GAMM|nr:3-deoxy-7-phosphoheptulonate synthase [Litorilituus lipolyticus]TPH17157.1 3-deoxy-7-phosphoheptulonate synthase [Litorilituus lipolyticus]
MLNHSINRLNEQDCKTVENTTKNIEQNNHHAEQLRSVTNPGETTLSEAKLTETKSSERKATKLTESPLITPEQLKQQLIVSPFTKTFIKDSQKTIKSIINNQDDRLVVIIGPCSIHDPAAALEYAKQLKLMSHEFSQELLIVMRVFLEKPRTTLGWKGLINDPHLDQSYDVNEGLYSARKLLLAINELGLATATEFLNINVASHISDLISWGAIGARTSQSQSHRELASLFDFPIGFKNTTDGNTQIAIDAITSAKESHTLYLPNNQGQLSICTSVGNKNSHLILRGGKQPNYSQQSIDNACQQLKKAKHLSRLMVDCSHSNSDKDHLKQKLVARDIANYIKQGSQTVFGLMIESFLVQGRQSLSDITQLTYGQSTTDACINLEQSHDILTILAKAIKQMRDNKAHTSPILSVNTG